MLVRCGFCRCRPQLPFSVVCGPWARFLSFAIRSLIETVACQHLIRRRQYLKDTLALDAVYAQSELLAQKLFAFRKRIAPDQSWVREGETGYLDEDREGTIDDGR